MNRTEPTAPVTGWDRTAVILLGTAGCALSYAALQQMAIAIHVLYPLTYVFPMVIDGFIAYGVRALLVLRAAPFRARLYIWTLFATATAASIWANALHAVRLNQQAPTAGLHLGDTTVGILSTLAPLALAGAVHLHILITRHDAPTTYVPAPLPPEAPQLAEPTPDDDEAITHDPTPEANQSPDESVRRIGRPPSAELGELLALVRPVFAVHENPPGT
jgi:hypothetical protein